MRLVVNNHLGRRAYLRYRDLDARQLQQIEGATFYASHRNSFNLVDVDAHYAITSSVATFVFDTSQTYRGGVIWADKDTGSDNASGPVCSQLEFSIVGGILTFNITQLEGMCLGIDAVAVGIGQQREEAQCGFDPAATPTPMVVSDKHVPNDKWAKNAGCSVDSMAKDCCHRFMARTSYAKGGFCSVLHAPEAACNAYCWAYDEKRCIDPNTCTFDEDCNPTDEPEHPAVLHTAVIDNNSTFTVSLSNLSSQLYTHMSSNLPVNYGTTTDAAMCANPRTCGLNETPAGGSASRFLVLALGGLIIAIVLVTVARRA